MTGDDDIDRPGARADVTLPAADKGRGSLSPRFGKKGKTSFYLSSKNFPVTVDGRRFQTVAKTAAKRWGLTALRWTSVKAGVQDGYSVAGFSTTCPPATLGVQTDYVKRGKVVERDLALRAGENWSAGPDYPGLDEIDLESVLIHELGHMAGNKAHTRAARTRRWTRRSARASGGAGRATSGSATAAVRRARLGCADARAPHRAGGLAPAHRRGSPGPALVPARASSLTA